MLYLVIARDGTDPDAPERRSRVRATHLREIEPLVKRGELQYAGALLDEDGGMIGSMLVFEADDEAAVRSRIENDIYSREGVWVDVEIHPFQRAV